jgi:phospholipid-binding lipoprotein MlaA
VPSSGSVVAVPSSGSVVAVPEPAPQAVPSPEPVTSVSPAPPVATEARPASAMESTGSASPAEQTVPTGSEPAMLAPAADGADDEKPMLLAQASTSATPPADDVDDVFDPWEPFNEKMFDLNLKLDRYVLKPVARVYRQIMPEPFQIMISNGFDNIRWVPRFINSMLQGKFGGAGREVSRFLINSTAGIAGLFDPAKDYWGIQPSNEDFGQTLGVWGAGPGPYLVLPVLAPTTVRDGVGMGVDLVIDPVGYFIGWFPTRFIMKIADTVNDRALNYDLFQGVEETTIDLYSSVRHFYLKRREQQIKD